MLNNVRRISVEQANCKMHHAFVFMHTLYCTPADRGNKTLRNVRDRSRHQGRSSNEEKKKAAGSRDSADHTAECEEGLCHEDRVHERCDRHSSPVNNPLATGMVHFSVTKYYPKRSPEIHLKN